MFRRIELLYQMSSKEYRVRRRRLMRRGGEDGLSQMRFRKAGLMYLSSASVADAWADLNAPRRPIGRNCRFYFTEAGWTRYGRPTITACQQTGQPYRVIKIKERSVDIVYRDEFQVAVRPKMNKAVRQRSLPMTRRRGDVVREH